MKRAVIRGIGHAVPAKVLTNVQLSEFVDTNDEWIVQRTGIRERRVCDGVEEGTYSLSVEAARRALDNAGVAAADVDFILVATVTGDFMWPATACHVQNALGIPHQCTAFDLSAACSGFVYGLATATAFLESGAARMALVIGMDTLSKQLNAGALPIPLRTVQASEVSATLGEDSVLASVKAGLVGMAAVMLFMVLYYRLPGLLASAALVVYTSVTLMIFKLVPVTLTL
ncbi:MAG: hypothetical protein C4320_05795, partial [Armatimonadota bacterium]